MTMEIAGDRPPRDDKKRHPFIVGRGPVPRHRRRNSTLAGDRPPRYGQIETGRSLLPGSHQNMKPPQLLLHRF